MYPHLYALSTFAFKNFVTPPPTQWKRKIRKLIWLDPLHSYSVQFFYFISYLVISFLRISKWYVCITSCKKKRENNRTAITTASRLTSNGNFSWPLGCSLQNTLFHSFHVASMGFFIHTKYISNKQGYQEIFELLKHTSNT